MQEFTLTRLLGGIANGRDVPGDWDLISEWQEPGTDRKTIYEKRAYFHGGDKFNVWVAVEVPQPDFDAIMFWHREMYRGDLVSAQKEIIRETMGLAVSYANVILAVGYAALAALLSQGKGTFTPLTFFSATICVAISAAAFVGWEIFGMIVRSNVNIGLAKAVNDPPNFFSLVAAHKERMAALVQNFHIAWVATISLAASFAVISFIIMMSAYIHAAWLALN